MSSEQQKCTKCRATKSIDEYYKIKKSDGTETVARECKACKREYSSERYRMLVGERETDKYSEYVSGVKKMIKKGMSMRAISIETGVSLYNLRKYVFPKIT